MILVSPSLTLAIFAKSADVFYVANKFVSHSATGYDLNRAILNIKGKSVADVAVQAKTTIAGPLRRAVTQLRREDPRAFEDLSGQAMAWYFLAFRRKPGHWRSPRRL